MSARSRFLKDRDPISSGQRRFERWLQERGYEGCSEMYPAAVLASALVDDYFEEYPERDRDRNAVERHAEGIGWVSDYESDEEENELIDDPNDW